jgi:hypothetical protein
MNRVVFWTALSMSTALSSVGNAKTVALSDTPNGVGVGLSLGSPTGISVVQRGAGPVTIAGAAAWSVPRAEIRLHADTLFEVLTIEDPNAPDMRFPVYAGIGARLELSEGTQTVSDPPVRLGLRVPLGISILPNDLPFDGFIEVVPVIGLLPSTFFDLDAAFGFRLFFR